VTYADLPYDKQGGIAWITINRPETRSGRGPADRARATEAFQDAWWNAGVVVLTGAGDRAFCSGGDQKARGSGRCPDGDPSGSVR
jgi:1,4-dihydroxy-2-naphthoyl-CoA synthase